MSSANLVGSISFPIYSSIEDNSSLIEFSFSFCEINISFFSDKSLFFFSWIAAIPIYANKSKKIRIKKISANDNPNTKPLLYDLSNGS